MATHEEAFGPGAGGDAGAAGRGLRLSLAPGWRLVLVALAITTLLWVLGRLEAESSHAFWPWFGPSLLLAAWCVPLVAILLLAAVRSRMIEPLFGGLDRAIRLHRQLAPLTVGVLVAHVALLVPVVLSEGGSLGDLLIPFWSPEAATLESLSLIALLVWTGFAYARWWSYEGWLSLHSLIGPLFLAGLALGLSEDGSTATAYEPMRFWMWFLILVGLGAWVYRALLFRPLAPRFRYRVSEVRQLPGGVVDFRLRPRDRRMLHEPGTFVFVNRPGADGRGWELHPFSLSSSPTERDLRISAQRVGDFTNALTTLEKDEPVEVFGPFGGFTPHRYARYRRLVCIGAGIGIAPFLAMLRFEATNDDFRRIWLWYLVRSKEEAAYDEELRRGVETADSYVDYELWESARQGRLTAARVMEAVAPLDDVAVMLCGSPAFVEDMTRQFLAQGLPPARIIADDLRFR